MKFNLIHDLARILYILIYYIYSSYFWGYMVDTKGRRKIMLPTLLIAFLISLVSSFAQNFYQFAALRFANGLFISAPSAIIYAYLGEFHNNKHRDRAMVFCSVIFAVACNAMPLIVWAIMNEEWAVQIPFLGITYKPYD